MLTLARRLGHQGITLMELLIASALAVVVAIGLGTMEGGRNEMGREVLERSGLTTEEGQVALATVQLAERIARADAFIATGGGSYQFRIPQDCPTPACLDNPASYQWDQYQLSVGILRLFQDTAAGCGTSRIVARDVTALTFSLSGNELAYVLIWDNGLSGPKHRSHEFQGTVASRAMGASPLGQPLSPVAAPGVC